MSDMHDAWFFIGVFVFIFLVWISVGGPTHPISFTGPTLSQPSPLGGGTYWQVPTAPFGVGGALIVEVNTNALGNDLRNDFGFKNGLREG